MTVVKIVENDIADKIDTQFISSQFPQIENTGITFICTEDGQSDDEWMDESGKRHIVINLPYQLVKQSTDVRSLMLAKAKERLDLVA